MTETREGGGGRCLYSIRDLRWPILTNPRLSVCLLRREFERLLFFLPLTFDYYRSTNFSFLLDARKISQSSLSPVLSRLVNREGIFVDSQLLDDYSFSLLCPLPPPWPPWLLSISCFYTLFINSRLNRTPHLRLPAFETFENIYVSQICLLQNITSIKFQMSMWLTPVSKLKKKC